MMQNPPWTEKIRLPNGLDFWLASPQVRPAAKYLIREIFRTLAAEHWSRIERVGMEFHELRPGDRHGELVSLFRQNGFRVEVRKPLVEYYLMRFG